MWRLSDLSAEFLALAELTSGHRIDESGAVVPLTTDELVRLWNELRVKYSEEFAVTPEQTRALVPARDPRLHARGEPRGRAVPPLGTDCRPRASWRVKHDSTEGKVRAWITRRPVGQ